MAADLVPIRLSVTAGDLFTLWAPPWRDAGDEWEAFLGHDEALYAFTSAADLAAFVRSGAENDLTDHPAWETLRGANAHSVKPGEDHHFDLIAVEELAAGKPSEESVAQLAAALSVVSAIGSVCELPAVTKFFNGNPSLTSLNNGVSEFSGRAGRKRWNALGTIIARSWEKVLTALEEVLETPEVDEKISAAAAEELDADPPATEDDDLVEGTEPDADDESDDADDDADDDDAPERRRAAGDTAVLGSDEKFWERVGIDPIQIMTGNGSLFTLRCYFNDRPIFLGRNGRISVFPSERALARYLADEHDHDLSDLVTYDDIRTAATDGSLDVRVSEENIYVLTDLADDITDDTVEPDHLELVVELLRDVGDYSEDDVVDKALDAGKPFGAFVAQVLDGADADVSHAEAASAYESLQRFVESRLRRE